MYISPRPRNYITKISKIQKKTPQVGRSLIFTTISTVAEPLTTRMPCACPQTYGHNVDIQ